MIPSRPEQRSSTPVPRSWPSTRADASGHESARDEPGPDAIGPARSGRPGWCGPPARRPGADGTGVVLDDAQGAPADRAGRAEDDHVLLCARRHPRARLLRQRSTADIGTGTDRGRSDRRSAARTITRRPSGPNLNSNPSPHAPTSRAIEAGCPRRLRTTEQIAQVRCIMRENRADSQE